MSKINISIDYNKINKDWLVHHHNGKVYLTMDVYQNDEPDKFGNTHAVKQSVPKEKRQKDMRIPYLGNGKIFDNAPRQQYGKQSDDDCPL